jgi:phage-related protein (TIGR01555 family)
MNVITRTLQMASKVAKDGLENVLTGIGVEGKDKRRGGSYKKSKFTRQQFETMHDESDLAKLAVWKVPSLGTKKWITHKFSEEQGGIETVKKIGTFEDQLKVKAAFKQAWAWARLYGGAGIFLSVDDGLKLEEPLNLNRIVKINALHVFNRHELQRYSINENLNSVNFGMPEYYTLSGKSGITDVPKIHCSRILRFDGSPLSERGFRDNDYWHDSVLHVLYQLIIDYDSAYAGVAHALQDFDLNVLKIKDLADIASNDNAELFTQRLKLMQLSKSIMSSIVLDASEESFEKLERQFSNIDKILERLDRRIVMAMGLPHTVVLGEGSTGKLSGAGESETGNLNDLVAAEQDEVLTNNLTYFYKVLMSSKQGPTNGKFLDSWTYDYNPLSEPTEMQEVSKRKVQAEIDSIYINDNVLSASEVAKSRFGGDEYTIETNIDLEAREQQEETNELVQDPEQAQKIIKGEE